MQRISLPNGDGSLEKSIIIIPDLFPDPQTLIGLADEHKQGKNFVLDEEVLELIEKACGYLMEAAPMTRYDTGAFVKRSTYDPEKGIQRPHVDFDPLVYEGGLQFWTLLGYLGGDSDEGTTFFKLNTDGACRVVDSPTLMQGSHRIGVMSEDVLIPWYTTPNTYNQGVLFDASCIHSALIRSHETQRITAVATLRRSTPKRNS